jgi:hypothetical protein
MRVTLPYLTEFTGRRFPSRPDQNHVGWARTEVEVPDADLCELDLVVCARYGVTNQSYYVGRRGFWRSAIMPNARGPFNGSGIAGEHVLDPSWDGTEDWLMQFSRTLSYDWFHRRAKAIAGRDGLSHGIRTSDSFRVKSFDETDLEIFHDWASSNLLAVDGRLMVRVHSPSRMITWKFRGSPLKDNCTLLDEVPTPQFHDSDRFDIGIHFDLDDVEGFHAAWAAANAVYDHGSPEYERPGVKEGIEREHPRFVCVGNVAYDPVLLASVVDARENMVKRTVLSIAAQIVGSSPLHLMAAGPKRDCLVEMKRIVDSRRTAPSSIDVDSLAECLAFLPSENQPARAFMIDLALERWHARPIGMFDNLTVAAGPRP